MRIKVRFINKLFSNENGFSIYAAEPTHEHRHDVRLNQYRNISISGEYTIEDSELHTKVFDVSIIEDTKSKYAGSYKIQNIHYDFPTDADEQWDFLENSNLTTMTQLFNLKSTFSQKDKILDIILYETERLHEVHGFGKVTAERLRMKTEADKCKAIIYMNFGKVPGVGPGLINKIAKWRPSVEEAIELIKANPFSLLSLPGVGFTVADAVRGHLDIPLDNRERCLHGIKHFITDTFQSTGNTYADLNEELPIVAEKLLVPVKVLVNYIKEEMETRSLEYRLKIFSKYITTEELFKAEQLISVRTNELKCEQHLIKSIEQWEELKRKVLSSHNANLSEEQEQFLDLINTQKMLLLIGPGGAGKSWVTKLACEMFKSAGLTFGLYAPTARAARVMSEYVNHPAATIHRGLMQYGFGIHCPDDIIILDEASMIDSELMAVVFNAMKPSARIIVIGDDFQLPSVGPGNVLFDFINHLEVPIVKLTKIFRQSEDSNIINVATSLREGNFRLPAQQTLDMNDITFINQSDSEHISKLGLQQYEKLYKKLKQEDIMFLSPVNQGPLGRKLLNKAIQKIVNGNDSKGQMIFGKNLPEKDQFYFRTDDYITISKNNYSAINEMGDPAVLINGDIGTIYIADQSSLIVKIGDEHYKFERDEVNENMDHVWCTTIHKSQGGQADSVIIVIPSNSWGLSANMLYTAITRAQKHCYIIGDFNALNRASRKLVNFNRQTMLSLAKRK